MRCVLIALLHLFVAVCSGQRYSIKPIHSSSGLYYEKIGEVTLSNNNWEFVTSIDYGGYLLFYQYLHEQAEKLHTFCEKYNSDYCEDRFANIKTRLNRIDETDKIMADYLGIPSERRRVKRFWAEITNFFSRLGNRVIGAVRVLFGADQPDLSKYNQQIGDLFRGQLELENKINLQTTLFKADAERKDYKIQWLEKTQNDIQEQIGLIQNDLKKDSEVKANQINELKNMLNETQEKIKKQGVIQKKLVKNVEIIQKKLLSVDQQINNLTENVANNKKSLDEAHLKIELNSLTIDYNMLMDNFETEQTKLFEAIRRAKRAKKGYLDPYILTPLNLIEMLQGIMPNLQQDEGFPFYPNIENAYHLYNLIEPNVYLYNNTLLFILKMPLINTNKFNLLKITSVPVPLAKNTFAFILPSFPFILVDNTFQEYTSLPLVDFKDSCEETEKTKYLCRQTRQIQLVHSSKECEIAIFKTVKNIPQSCDKRVTYLEEAIFLQLQKKNSWIYVAPKPETFLSITCDSEPPNLALVEASGFINISDKCLMRADNLPLKSLIEFTKPVESHYSPPIDLVKFIDISEVEQLDFKTLKKPKQLILPFEFEELRKISLGVGKVKTGSSKLYFLLLIPVIALIGLAIFFIYKSDFNKYKVILIRKFTRSNNIENGINDDRLRMKVKMLNKNEKISKVSVHENQIEDDPDAEYLVVRFKVKKDKEVNPVVPSHLEKLNNSEKNIINNKISPVSQKPKNINQKSNLHEKDEDEEEEADVNVYGNFTKAPKCAKDTDHLMELRKMKPKPSKYLNELRKLKSNNKVKDQNLNS